MCPGPCGVPRQTVPRAREGVWSESGQLQVCSALLRGLYGDHGNIQGDHQLINYCLQPSPVLNKGQRKNLHPRRRKKQLQLGKAVCDCCRVAGIQILYVVNLTYCCACLELDLCVLMMQSNNPLHRVCLSQSVSQSVNLSVLSVSQSVITTCLLLLRYSQTHIFSKLLNNQICEQTSTCTARARASVRTHGQGDVQRRPLMPHSFTLMVARLKRQICPQLPLFISAKQLLHRHGWKNVHG